jgi:hypothetical protein
MVRHPATRGFTVVELMFAMLLLTVVGAATAGFLSAMATGGEARRHASDPALESALATRRFKLAAPDYRYLLSAQPTEALLWLHDFVPSRTVHASEAGMLRFDEAAGLLVLETVDSAYLDSNRGVEREYLSSQYQQLLDLFASLREDGALRTSVIAEGIGEIAFETDEDDPTLLRVTFSVDEHAATFLLTPPSPEEPIG